MNKAFLIMALPVPLVVLYPFIVPLSFGIGAVPVMADIVFLLVYLLPSSGRNDINVLAVLSPMPF